LIKGWTALVWPFYFEEQGFGLPLDEIFSASQNLRFPTAIYHRKTAVLKTGDIDSVNLIQLLL
jgi:hypothetical protein